MSSSPRPCNNTTFCWLTRNLIKKLAHTTHGNWPGKVTLATGYWNCSRGLPDSSKDAAPKLKEIEQFISIHDLDILAIAEASLHGP